MKGVLSLLVALLGFSARADVETFFVAGSQGIYRGTLDTKKKQLGQLKLVCAVQHPNFLALSSDGRFLYATLDRTVAAFEVGPGGSLKPMNEAATGGAGPCHVSIDPMGNNLLVSNYDGGNVASIRIRSDGAVGEKVAQMNFTGRGPDPKRQTKPYGHYAQVSPDGAWLYACDLGTDSVWFYPYDCTTGAIGSEETTLPGKVLPGSGPRHFVFNRDASRLYVVNEMGRSITTFTRDASTGSLHPLETVMALPPNTPAEGVTSAGIALHPSGHWLYVSNRGCDMLSVLAIDPQSGQLTLRESIPSVVVMPRHFTLDPSGLFLIAAGQKDGRIALFTIDPETGLLTATNQTATAPGAICVVSAR